MIIHLAAEYIAVDKTANFYRMSTDDYKSLLRKNIEKEYKIAPQNTEHRINAQAKTIAQNLQLDNRTETLAKKNSFISLKDHKDNFRNYPTCRLISPN